MLLSFFRLTLAIRNVWPRPMSPKAFLALYMLLLFAGMPVTLLGCIPYGLFGILAAACIYGLAAGRDTASQNACTGMIGLAAGRDTASQNACTGMVGLAAGRNTAPQNVCMGMVGFVLTVAVENLLSIFLDMIIPPAFLNQPLASFFASLVYLLLFYLITLLCGRLIKKILLPSKGILRFPQAWYVIDAVLLLLITTYLFDDLIPGQNGSVGRMIYNNALHLLGYLLVMLFLFLAMRRSYQEQIQTEAKQKALQDLQGYTHNLETMYNSLRSFKHDYVNILLSMSGYIENGDMGELEKYFEEKIFPTKNLIDQGDYKLNQLSSISVLEIKSLLYAKMIYAHDSGIDVTIDIPGKVGSFPMDTVDLARILGIFLDNAVEAALETEHPQLGLNIIQNQDSIAIIISNRFQEKGITLHQLKQKGFTTKTGHLGIGLSNVQKIIRSYDNVLLETRMQHDCFTQHMELTMKAPDFHSKDGHAACRTAG